MELFLDNIEQIMNNDYIPSEDDNIKHKTNCSKLTEINYQFDRNMNHYKTIDAPGISRTSNNGFSLYIFHFPPGLHSFIYLDTHK